MKERNNTKKSAVLTRRVTRSMSKNKKYTISQPLITVTRQRKQLLKECPVLRANSTITLKDVIDAVEWYIKNKDLLCTKKKKRQVSKTFLNHRTLEILSNAIEELKELNEMIGMTKVKQTVVEHVLYLAQDLSSDDDFNHIQITGTPGCGKTTLAIILGRIYANLGMLEYGEVITATRSDLIGPYLGSSAQKTQEVLELATGNVLFLDEIYSLGCYDNRDSFSKECIDTINLYLSEHRHEILVIICGYKDEINTCFFAHNKGLERRFGWTYNIDAYTVNELQQVFKYQIKQTDWSLCNDISTQEEMSKIFSDQNLSLFSNQGGSTEILLTRCKIAHSSRIFCTNKVQKQRTLNASDLHNGFESYKEHVKSSSTNTDKSKYAMMYV